MKIFRNVAIILVILVGLTITTVCLFYNFNLSPVSKSSELKTIEISSGSVASVGRTLKENNLIKNEMVFKAYTKINKKENLQAGTYQFSESMSMEEIINMLTEGKTVEIIELKITFKEGVNFNDIANIIAENTSNTEEDVYNTLKDVDYINDLINKYWFLSDDILDDKIYYSLEGYLFPDTYFFENEDVSVKEIFNKMLDKMASVLNNYKEEIENTSFSVHEILTIASMVETEGINDQDRGKIASVIYNRLTSKMALEIDATTIYGAKLKMNEHELLPNHLNDQNPYNTRGNNAVVGLPIGPIANPGASSIEATINPDITSYLYYIADNEMNTYFTNTYSEHIKKKNELIRAGKFYR